MPPKKGGKNKKGGKKKNGTDAAEQRTLTLKDDMQDYAKVMKLLGDRNIIVVLPDSSEVRAHIPGRFRKKKIWVLLGDIILVSRRDFQDNILDVVHKYQSDEIRKIHKDGEIPDFFLDALATNDGDSAGTGNIGIDFDDEVCGFDFEDI